MNKEHYPIREPSADILTLLAAHAQTYEISASDWNRLTWEDIALAIADIENDGARYLGRIYVLQQTEFVGHLTHYLVEDLMRRARIRRWTPRLRYMCAIALFNFVEYPWCSTCNGADKMQEEKVIGKFTCPTCLGVRTKTKPTVRTLAESLGVSHPAFIYSWQSKYECAWDTLERLFDIVNGGLAWRVKSLRKSDV